MVVPILLHVLLGDSVLEGQPQLCHQSLPSLTYSRPNSTRPTPQPGMWSRRRAGHVRSGKSLRNRAKYLVLISILRVVESCALRIEVHLSARVFLTTRAVQLVLRSTHVAEALHRWVVQLTTHQDEVTRALLAGLGILEHGLCGELLTVAVR